MPLPNELQEQIKDLAEKLYAEGDGEGDILVDIPGEVREADGGYWVPALLWISDEEVE